ncbi:MAG: hypothetical protein J7L99_03205 [Planctomycetes bacterium]|nr:hypothetical protein [Planctomycetota bacterium]
MTAYALHNLQDYLKIHSYPKIFEPYQFVGYIESEIRERFKIDTVNLTLGPKRWVERETPWGFKVLLPEKWNEETAPDGATVVRGSDGTIIARRPPDSFYFDPVNPPLQNITDVSEIENYKDVIYSFDLPSFVDETDDDIRNRAQSLHEDRSCVVLNLCCHILAAGQLLRGYENFMVDLLADEKMVRKLLDLLIEGYLRRVDWLGPLLKDKVDIVLLNDDLGTQNGPMLSLDTYRKMIKPYQKELFGYIKKVFEKSILFHSCGAVREFIPDLIEIGVDALNPVQLSANGMQLEGLKRDFGKDITFWGGGVDTQSVLNRETPDKVKDSVKRNVDILAAGGGFVFCQVHNIQPDVPPENVIAMYEALDEIGC